MSTIQKKVEREGNVTNFNELFLKITHVNGSQELKYLDNTFLSLENTQDRKSYIQGTQDRSAKQHTRQSLEEPCTKIVCWQSINSKPNSVQRGRVKLNEIPAVLGPVSNGSRCDAYFYLLAHLI